MTARPHSSSLPKAYTPAELEALRRVPKHPRDQALIEVLAGCGLRVSEACHLTLTQVHWSTQIPSLRFHGKRGKERVVPLNLQAQDALRTWLEQRGEVDTPYLFCGLRTGEQLSRKTVWALLRRHAQRAGLRPLHPHMLRHTFGTHLADRDVPVERIRELMGHASITTSQLYIAVSAAQKQAAVARLDQRSWLARWLSRLRHRSFRFYDPCQPGLSTSQTVGRRVELSRLQANADKRIDTLILGPPGIGKSHLLSLVQGEQLIHLKTLTPVRPALVEIARALHQAGVFPLDPQSPKAAQPATGETPAPGGRGVYGGAR